MKPLPRALFSALSAAALAAWIYFSTFASARPSADRALLAFVPAAALAYLLWNSAAALPALQASAPQNRINAAAFLKKHAPGILLALFFLSVYIFIGLRLNIPNKDTTDNFLDADNYPWSLRIAAPDGFRQEMRAPHPFAFFIFRPLGLALNVFTRSPLRSAALLNALAGALCVFLAWMFVKRAAENSTYALLFAALLGVSASHLFFGAVIETYIFSAAAMMAFFVLLQARRSAFALIAASVVTFGVTFTNLAQNFIGYAMTRWKGWASAKEIFRFAALVLSIGVLMSVAHAAVYPSARLFFLPSDIQRETEFSYSIVEEPAWRAVGRVTLLTRVMFLYAVVAPEKPYVFLKEMNEDFPRFNLFKIEPGTFSLSAYHGLGNILIAAWALMMLAGGALFIHSLLRRAASPFALAFALALAFNFALHLNYGFELFLYTPDWTYALVLFLALAFAPLANNRIFHAALFIFLLALAYNQAQFFQFIFQTIAPFVYELIRFA
ncbi:MAG: hypothetical protein Fur002_26640 [Anaerolineales bacterium]